jgi:hypothetical protein
MLKGRPAYGVERVLGDQLARLNQIVGGKWNLPINFERQGDVLVGTLGLAVQADLMKMGRSEAEDLIALLFRQAILQCAEPTADVG